MSRNPLNESTRRLVISELYVKYAKQLYARAYKAFRGDVHDAEDCVQETYKAAFLQFERDLMHKTSPEQHAWLQKTLSHKVIDRWRAAGREIPVVNIAETPMTNGDLAAKVASDELLARCWAVIVQELTWMEHRVAFLRFEVEWPIRIIAYWLGVSEGTVRSHLSRARSKLEKAGGRSLLFPDSVGSVESAKSIEGVTE